LPQDSDGDEIPDYVEDANGNGAQDAGETDWTTNFSGPDDPAGEDRSSSVYDDVDLSGNGLVGRIKKALGMTALDTSNPLALRQLPPGTEPDIVTIDMPSLPVNYDTLAGIGQLQLCLDGTAIPFQQCAKGTDGNCLLQWDTTLSTPGSHVLSAQITLNGKIQRGPTPDPTILTGTGPLWGFYSANVAQFDPVYSTFNTSHGAILYALLREQGATYSIELRTPSGQHIKTITGSTADSAIKEVWYPLTDDNSIPFTGDSVDAVFDVTLSSGAHSVSHYRVHQNNYEVPDGDFTVAFAWDTPWSDGTGPMRDAIQFGVVDPLTRPPDLGGQNGGIYNSTFNDYTWWGDLFGNPGYLADNVDLLNLNAV
jgi:hypothetical protein